MISSVSDTGKLGKRSQFISEQRVSKREPLLSMNNECTGEALEARFSYI